MAAFVLYNVETTKLVTPAVRYSKTFGSAAAAKAARTRAGLNPAEYAVTDSFRLKPRSTLLMLPAQAAKPTGRHK